MQAVTLYHNPRCSKSRQALELLEQQPVALTVVRYLEQPPSADDLETLAARLGGQAAELVRRREANELGIGDLQGRPLYEALAANPRALQRPIVTTEKVAVIARPPEKALDILND